MLFAQNTNNSKLFLKYKTSQNFKKTGGNSDSLSFISSSEKATEERHRLWTGTGPVPEVRDT